MDLWLPFVEEENETRVEMDKGFIGGYKDIFGDDGYIHYLDCNDGFRGAVRCQGNQTVHFKYE